VSAAARITVNAGPIKSLGCEFAVNSAYVKFLRKESHSSYTVALQNGISSLSPTFECWAAYELRTAPSPQLTSATASASATAAASSPQLSR
jgi:hypothetical protein